MLHVHHLCLECYQTRQTAFPLVVLAELLIYVPCFVSDSGEINTHSAWSTQYDGGIAHKPLWSLVLPLLHLKMSFLKIKIRFFLKDWFLDFAKSKTQTCRPGCKFLPGVQYNILDELLSAVLSTRMSEDFRESSWGGIWKGRGVPVRQCWELLCAQKAHAE